jgi:hypothetical protein
MAHSDWEQIEREVAEAQYMRNALMVSRAATAIRAADGKFCYRKFDHKRVFCWSCWHPFLETCHN